VTLVEGFEPDAIVLDGRLGEQFPLPQPDRERIAPLLAAIEGRE